MRIDVTIKNMLNEIEENLFKKNPELFNLDSFESMAEMVAHLKKIGWIQ